MYFYSDLAILEYPASIFKAFCFFPGSQDGGHMGSDIHNSLNQNLLLFGFEP